MCGGRGVVLIVVECCYVLLFCDALCMASMSASAALIVSSVSELISMSASCVVSPSVQIENVLLPYWTIAGPHWYAVPSMREISVMLCVFIVLDSLASRRRVAAF